MVVGFLTPPLARALELVWGEVVVCSDLGQALRACALRRPLVLLVDEDCIEAAPEELVAGLRQALGAACPLVLLLTAFPWLDAGADRTIQKPVEANGLAAVLEALRSSGRGVDSRPAPPVGEAVEIGEDEPLAEPGAPVSDPPVSGQPIPSQPVPSQPVPSQPVSGKRLAEARPGRYQLDGPGAVREELPVVVVSSGGDRGALTTAFARVAEQVIATEPERALQAVAAVGRCVVVVWAPDQLDTLLLASVMPPSVSLLSVVPITDGRRGRSLRRCATGFELDWPAPTALLRRALASVRTTSIPPPSIP